jgi:hypothetical protein
MNVDGGLNIADVLSLLWHLFLGEGPGMPCGDGASAAAASLPLVDANGDGIASVTDCIYVLNYLFLGGKPHILGAGCTRIPGCPDVCGN